MIEENLPETIKEMVIIIGLTASLALVCLRGGRTLAIPKNIISNHWLIEAVGADAFKKLVNYYHGEEIEIPMCNKVVVKITHYHIINESKKGASTSNLAQNYGYTQRGIRKIINSK